MSNYDLANERITEDIANNNVDNANANTYAKNIMKSYEQDKQTNNNRPEIQEQMQQQVAISLQKLGLASLVVTTRTLLGYDTLLTYSNNSFAAINELVQTVTALYPNGTSYNTTIAGDLYSLKSEYGYTIIQWHSVKL